MIGILLGLLGTLFFEINNALLKDRTKKYHIITLWVVTTFMSMSIFWLTWLYKYFFTDISIYYNPDSLSLLILRTFLEILQSYFTITALKHCDRSTFSILRILTIPFLVIVDMLLWYQFSLYSYIWLFIILFSFVFFNTNLKTVNWKWWYYGLFISLNAVLTLSLFKYSLTNYWNSVEVDQFFVWFSTLIFFMFYNFFFLEKKLGFHLFKKEKIFILQWMLIWIWAVLISYTYSYLNASEATALKRVWEMIWALSSWYFIFKETNMRKKIIFACCLIFWIFIMIL